MSGPPSDYTQETAAHICAEIADGRSLRSICREPGMPSKSTVFHWLTQFPEFEKQYVLALDARADVFVEEVLDIADDGSNDWMTTNDPENPGYRVNKEHIARSRLRVDTRKWIAAKMKPKKYGDRVAAELTGKDGGPIQTQEISDADAARRIAFILAKGLAATQEKQNGG